MVHGTFFGIPAPRAACRAGACPTPACTTFPIKTSLTKVGSKSILSKAPLIAATPRSTAVSEDKLPKKLPIGVRTAETITISFCILFVCFLIELKSKEYQTKTLSFSQYLTP